VLSYRNEMIFTDCSIRDYWDAAPRTKVTGLHASPLVIVDQPKS